MRLAFIGWFVTVVSVGSTVFYGRARPETASLEAIGFTACGNKLCYFGIEPDVTKRDQALTILEEHGAVRASPREDVYVVGHFRVTLHYDFQSQRVTYISVIDHYGDPLPATAGDAIGYLGTPCSFNPNIYQSHNLTLVYPNTTFTLQFASPVIGPTTQINYIELGSGSQFCNSGPPWPGFTSVKRYIDLYKIGRS